MCGIAGIIADNAINQALNEGFPFTSFADAETVQAAVIAGAHGYILKEIDSQGLIRSIETVADGQSILDPLLTDQVFNWIKNLQGSTASGHLGSLSPQEHRVIKLAGDGKTNKEIAGTLGLSDKTVKNYLANAFEKLGITRRAQAASLLAQGPSSWK